MAVTPSLSTDNIQGNIRAGFNKDHQSSLLVSFPPGSDPNGWLAGGTQAAAPPWPSASPAPPTGSA